ncbi:unnamed protein product, partial [Rotaria sp. Silwood2]
MAFSLGRSLFSFTTPSTTTNNNNTIDQETIESLCDRLQTAKRIKDRRHIVCALKALSKKCKLEVGTKSITLLANILQGDRTDFDLIQLVLETLTNLITYDVGSDEEQSDLPQELYIQNKKRVHVVLELIAKTNFNVRRAAIRFLTALLTNCTTQLQDIILEDGPVSISKLVDLLKDKREVIRNDALILLQILIVSNPDMQDIVASGKGFERLVEIFVREGFGDEVTVQYCLSVILNLLKGNQPIQRSFNQRYHIQRLADFLKFCSNDEKLWSTQKVTNVNLLLQIIRTLVSPENSSENIVAYQRTFEQYGILHRLYVILKLLTVPADVLIETLQTISDVVHDDTENQKFLNSVVNISGVIQQSVLFNLLNAMINGEHQSFSLRISILYFLQCYLYNNESGKSMIVRTFSDQTANQYTLGHLLLNGYSSKDIIASWCSGITLAHLIVDDSKCKETILKVVLPVDSSQTGVKTLIEISMDILQNSSSSLHTRVAVLIFLSSLLSNSSSAVQALLSVQNGVSY